MSHRLLSNDGTIRPVSVEEIAETVVVDATDPNAALNIMMQASADSILLIELPSSADGRGFSVIGHLTASGKDAAPTTWLTGDLIPDQLTLAFQCGASAVLISDEMWEARGEQSWLNALNPSVKLAYRSQVWANVSDISQLRE